LLHNKNLGKIWGKWTAPVTIKILTIFTSHFSLPNIDNLNMTDGRECCGGGNPENI